MHSTTAQSCKQINTTKNKKLTGHFCTSIDISIIVLVLIYICILHLRVQCKEFISARNDSMRLVSTGLQLQKKIPLEYNTMSLWGKTLKGASLYLIFA